MGVLERGCRKWYLGLRTRQQQVIEENCVISSLMIYTYHVILFVGFWRNNTPPPPQWARTSSFRKFLDHKRRRITVGRTPLDEWSVRLRDLYLTTHDTLKRQTSMLLAGFETHNFSRRAATDPRLRPRGHWDRQRNIISFTTSRNMRWVEVLIGKPDGKEPL